MPKKITKKCLDCGKEFEVLTNNTRKICIFCRNKRDLLARRMKAGKINAVQE